MIGSRPRWALGLLLVLLSACGGGAESSEQRPLTPDEAARLAQTGYANYLAGGATFEANSAFLGTGRTDAVTLSGWVDWANHTGRAVVRADTDPDLVEVYWEQDVILERRTGIDGMVTSLGGPTQPWFVRSPAPADRQVDRLIAIIVGLAMEQPENALLIQQKEGSVFMRVDSLRDTSVDVLRYGERNVYWVNHDTGALLRFEANAESGTAPVVIDLIDVAPVEVRAPAVDDVVSPDDFPELYDLVYPGS